MPRTQRYSHEAVISALMLTGNVNKAAEKLGCQPRLIYNRLNKDEEFKQLYSQARTEQVKLAAAKLQRYTNTAIDCTLQIMLDKKTNPAVRLQAAQTVLNYSVKLTELSDLSERIQAIENALKERN